MGALDAINNIGFHIPSPDDCASDGNGDIFADTKGYQPVDPATRPEITATDESAKYAGNVAGWSQSDAYGNNEYANEVARNALNQHTYGTNPFSNDDFTRSLYQQQQGAGFKLFGLA